MRIKSPYIPGGSYLQTCRNIRVTLTCEAQKMDQTWDFASFELSDCPAVLLENIDGMLKIHHAAPPRPYGRIINVLVAVDVSKALAHGNLNPYLYMFDTHGQALDGNQGGHSLLTSLDTLIWNVVSIDPAQTVSIGSFGGAAIPAMINPVAYPESNGTRWGGVVHQSGTMVPYTVTLLLSGHTAMSFDANLSASDLLQTTATAAASSTAGISA